MHWPFFSWGGEGSPEDPPLASSSYAARLAGRLREQQWVWHALVRRAGVPVSFGSLAAEVFVVGVGGGAAVVPDGVQPSTLLRAAVIAHLCAARHMSRRLASRHADSLVDRLGRANAGVAGALGPVLPPPAGLTLSRCALKHVQDVDINPRTGTAWFLTGHANLVAVYPTGVGVLLEPGSARCLVSGLPEAVARGLGRPDLHLAYLACGLASPGDGLCTVWCAVVALLLLLNPQAASPQAVVEWAAPHRAALLASFLRFARGVVGEG